VILTILDISTSISTVCEILILPSKHNSNKLISNESIAADLEFQIALLPSWDKIFETLVERDTFLVHFVSSNDQLFLAN
jgi:hypothetical protein